MSTSNEQMNKFLYGGMTPRAWRMISYICIGTTLYGMVFLTETLQNFKLNRIDRQMKALEQLEGKFEVDQSTFSGKISP